MAEAELEADIRRSLRMIYFTVWGDALKGLFFVPKPMTAKLLDGQELHGSTKNSDSQPDFAGYTYKSSVQAISSSHSLWVEELNRCAVEKKIQCGSGLPGTAYHR